MIAVREKTRPSFDARSAAGGYRETWLLRGFARYARRYVRSHFDALRLLGDAPAIPSPDEPLVVYVNHASWWDPLTLMVLLRHCFPDRSFAAPMDAIALERYGILRRLGCFFAVEPGTTRGARQFLASARAILAENGRGLCVTPQGRFADVRERPIHLAGGLAHLLASHEPAPVVLPLALEYTFWNERTPNVFAHFGVPMERAGTAPAWQRQLETGLAETQHTLAAAVIAREPAAFTSLLQGRAGTGGVYGWWQRVRSWCGGRAHDERHPPAR